MSKATKVTSEQAAEVVEEKNPVILDVRPDGLYETGHIKGAKEVPVDSLDSNVAKNAIRDKDTPVLLYCQTGLHSGIAAKKLEGMGYTNVYDMSGGLNDYHGELGATVKDADPDKDNYKKTEEDEKKE
ncbi:MAG: rhodanese-like domain-containing protein [Eggerthellaceae bacterium]|nr:rhodanese-like domain-containing protein [Eggerthellaceae bacterium]